MRLPALLGLLLLAVSRAHAECDYKPVLRALAASDKACDQADKSKSAADFQACNKAAELYMAANSAYKQCETDEIAKQPTAGTAAETADKALRGGQDSTSKKPGSEGGVAGAAGKKVGTAVPDSSSPVGPLGGGKEDPMMDVPPEHEHIAEDPKVEEKHQQDVSDKLANKLGSLPPDSPKPNPDQLGIINSFGTSAMGFPNPNAGTLNNYGRYALNSDDPGRAEQLTSAAIQADPSNSDSFGLRGAARLSMGRLKEAKDDAKTALSLNPANTMGQTVSQFAANMERDPGAKPPDPSKLIRGFGSGSAGALGGGRTAADQGGVGLGGGSAGMIGSERAGGASFATMTPSNKLSAEAEGLVKIGDVKGALKQATQAIEADKKNPEAYAVRAGIWNKQQRYLLAHQDANSALDLQPGHGKALNARAFAYNMTGHPKEAREDAEKALAANPRDAMGYLNLAMSQEALGETSQAKENYQKAAKLDPSMKVFYEDFLSKHPELNEGGGGGGSMAILPPVLRTKKGAGAAAGAAALIAVAVLLRRRRSSGQEEDDDAPAEAASAPEPSQGAETVAFSAPEALSTLPAGATTTAPGFATTAPSHRTTGPNGGQLIAGNYEVRKELGRGGMGVVYEAFDTSLGRKVAIKEMRAEIAQSARDKERFLSEARTVAKFQHPNIVAIYAILEDQGRAFLVFEHVEGGGLDKILDQHRRLPAESAVPLLKGIASALDYSHSRKVIHRDLKPSNIMITEEGVVKVMDFGIAHEAKQTVSRLTNAEAFGTMAYMPPEQELGQASKESDVFAFAVLAYETLVGAMPFPGPNFLEQKRGKLFKPPSQADPSLPAALDAVFEKALDPEPKKRHASASDFADAVAAALAVTA